MDMIHEECLKYFKSNKGYMRLFVKIKEKYRTLGYLGGSIKIENLTPEEQETLSGFFKKNFYNKKSTTIKIENFLKALDSTRFSGVDFERILMEYFDETIISKKEEQNKLETEKEKFFNDILIRFKGTKAEDWIKYILINKENAYKLIIQKYERDKLSLRKTLILIAEAINKLSFDVNKTERLAIFSSNISKNPHTFDIDRDEGRLLLYGISYFLKEHYPENAQKRAELLYKAGIIDDEVSNYTIASGLLAYKDGKLHEGWEGFYKSYEPMQISLYNLSRVDKIIAPKRIVYIFENPTVFSEILERTRDKKPALICTYGQIKLASKVLLDKLIDNVDNIYYSGDFDPEGLLIADKLIQRYGKKITLWHYGIDDYKSIISNKKISPQRLKKLSNLKTKELITLAEEIQKTGLAAYQELLIDKYLGTVH
ncbi:MAG: TIGR02679 domain-containing protein [Caloramator sp.]|nr:TIGR02679 domain-containing protein [Caloramator sp.]